MMNPSMFRAMALRGGGGMPGQMPAPAPTTPGGTIPSPMQPMMGGIPNQPMPMQPRAPMPGPMASPQQNLWSGPPRY